MVFGSNRDAIHVLVDLDRLHQAVDGLVRVDLLVRIRRVHIIDGRIVLVARLGVQIARLAERAAGLRPVLGHFERDAGLFVVVDGLLQSVRAVPTPEE